MCVSLHLINTECQNPHSASKVGDMFAKWGHFAEFKGLFEGLGMALRLRLELGSS